MTTLSFNDTFDIFGFEAPTFTPAAKAPHRTLGLPTLHAVDVADLAGRAVLALLPVSALAWIFLAF